MAIAVIFLCGLLTLSNSTIAQEMKFFSIGTGGTGATYYPLGGTIAHAISNPPGSRICSEGGSCGVPGLVSMAQSSRGSVDNIDGIKSSLFHSGFSQSDIAYWAYTGTGKFNGQSPANELRAIAALYLEHIQLVARKGANIKTVADLKGKRVSLDERGSGSYVNALQILNAYGMEEKDIEVQFLKSAPASDAIISNTLDAFFVTAGYPTNAVIELASRADIMLVPIDGPNAQKIVDSYGFYSIDEIPASAYKNLGPIKTLAVGAQWITSAEVEDKLIYEITKALWNKKSRRLLDIGHSKGTEVTLSSALQGIAIPLHPGAERFYKEMKLLK